MFRLRLTHQFWYSKNHLVMIKIRFPLFLWFLLMTVQIFSQDQVRVDSLEKLLKKVKTALTTGLPYLLYLRSIEIHFEL